MVLSTILPSLLRAELITFTDRTCFGCWPNALAVAGFIAAVLAVAFLMTAAQNRRPGPDDSRPRLCRACALSHPPFAHYCRRCGRRL
jgi:hypothetical protein